MARSRATLLLLGLTALASAAVAGATLAAHGTSSEGLQQLARNLARVSFPIFLVVFSASPLHALWPGAAARWLVRERRGLGTSYALAHFAHLGGVIAFAWRSGVPPDPVVAVAGGLAYALLAAMAATSNDAAQRALGARRWRALHRTGLYYLWFIHAASYAGSVAADRAYWPGLALTLGVGALRLAAFAKRRYRSSTSAATSSSR
jgi:DMSO/TMAO reductase YedYZ heme-binding membrane subunit